MGDRKFSWKDGKMVGKKGQDGLALKVARLGILGKSPVAPGTVGTLFAGVPAAWALALIPEAWANLVIVLLFFMACVVSETAQRLLEQRDPGQVVIDELVGFLVTMSGLPADALSLGVGFFAFRAMDIWKPWPVNVLDRELKGGLGIVADDVAAGLYAHVVVAVFLQIAGNFL